MGWIPELRGSTADKKYIVETSSKVIERCLLMSTDPVCPPSCSTPPAALRTTAYVAEQWGPRMDHRRYLPAWRSRSPAPDLEAAKFPTTSSPIGRPAPTAR